MTQKKSYGKFYGGAKQLVLSQEKLKETLYNMVEMVEDRISAEMKDATRGSILHDVWMNNGVHFVAIFACYIKKIGTSSSSVVIEETHIVFLALLEIHQIEACDGDKDDSAADDDGDEAVGFSAEVHSDYIRILF